MNCHTHYLFKFHKILAIKFLPFKYENKWFLCKLILVQTVITNVISGRKLSKTLILLVKHRN